MEKIVLREKSKLFLQFISYLLRDREDEIRSFAEIEGYSVPVGIWEAGNLKKNNK